MLVDVFFLALIPSVSGTRCRTLSDPDQPHYHVCLTHCFYHSYAFEEGLVESYGCQRPGVPFVGNCGVEKCCSIEGPSTKCSCSGDICTDEFIEETRHSDVSKDAVRTFSSIVGASFVMFMAWTIPIWLLLRNGFFSLTLRARLTLFRYFFYFMQCIKFLLTAAGLIVLWFPLSVSCEHHSLGVYRSQWIFYVQLNGPSLCSSLACVAPLHYIFFVSFSLYSMFYFSQCVYRSFFFVFFEILPLSIWISSSVVANNEFNATLKDMDVCYVDRRWLFEAAVILCTMTAIFELISSSLLFVFHFFSFLSSFIEPVFLPQEGRPIVDGTTDWLTVEPNPVLLFDDDESLLRVQNNRKDVWMAVRVLLSVRVYDVTPSRLLVPPSRTVTVGVRLRAGTWNARYSADHSLLVEWFVVGTACPSRDALSMWTKPHFRPRSQWKHLIVPIYHEALLDNNSCVSP